MSSTAICILGMHRSGTSATTGMLQLLGVELGEHLSTGHPDVNALGYFEHTRIQSLNDELLGCLQSSWDDVLPILSDAPSRADAVEAMKQRLLSVLQSDFGSETMWAVKDPRICRLLGTWNELFAEMGVKPVYLHVVRHPYEVAASLTKRNGFASDKSYCMWLDHVLSAELGSRQGRRCFAFYDRVLSEPVREAVRIGDALNIVWPVAVDDVKDGLRLFLSDDLRHHDEVPPTPEEPWAALAFEMYETMFSAGSGGLAQDVWDQFHERFDARRRGFDPAIVAHLRQETKWRIHWERRTYGLWNSRSWRLTKPLRAVQRWFGGEER